MQIKELVIHEWTHGDLVYPVASKVDGKTTYLIAFEFQNVEDARDVVDAVAKAVQSCK